MGVGTFNAAAGGVALPFGVGDSRGTAGSGSRCCVWSQSSYGSVVARAGANCGDWCRVGNSSWPGTQTEVRREEARRADCGNAANQAQRRDALELPKHGESPGCEQEHREPALAITQPEASPEPHVQVVARSTRCRKVAGSGNSDHPFSGNSDHFASGNSG